MASSLGFEISKIGPGDLWGDHETKLEILKDSGIPIYPELQSGPYLLTASDQQPALFLYSRHFADLMVVSSDVIRDLRDEKPPEEGWNSSDLLDRISESEILRDLSDNLLIPVDDLVRGEYIFVSNGERHLLVTLYHAEERKDAKSVQGGLLHIFLRHVDIFYQTLNNVSNTDVPDLFPADTPINEVLGLLIATFLCSEPIMEGYRLKYTRSCRLLGDDTFYEATLILEPLCKSKNRHKLAQALRSEDTQPINSELLVAVTFHINPRV